MTMGSDNLAQIAENLRYKINMQHINYVLLFDFMSFLNSSAVINHFIFQVHNRETKCDSLSLSFRLFVIFFLTFPSFPPLPPLDLLSPPENKYCLLQRKSF